MGRCYLRAESIVVLREGARALLVEFGQLFCLQHGLWIGLLKLLFHVRAILGHVARLLTLVALDAGHSFGTVPSKVTRATTAIATDHRAHARHVTFAAAVVAAERKGDVSRQSSEKNSAKSRRATKSSSAAPGRRLGALAGKVSNAAASHTLRHRALSCFPSHTKISQAKNKGQSSSSQTFCRFIHPWRDY